MLRVPLDAEEEARLARYARTIGRSESVIARDWILDHLSREELDPRSPEAIERHANDATDAWLRQLDAEDGGYDWGPDGPPRAR